LIAQGKTDITTPKLLKDVLWSMNEAKAEEKVPMLMRHHTQLIISNSIKKYMHIFLET
jgi:hypothetical protein